MAQVSTSSARFIWLFAAIAATSCATNPATGKNQLMLVSEDQEIAMGRQADTAVIATIGLYPDAAWQSYIQQFGARLAATSERRNLPWTFRVVDEPAVGALRGSRRFSCTSHGLLTISSTRPRASVVGHEIGHVRHGTAAGMSKQS
jgi:predicted Zn-dependent protease